MQDRRGDRRIEWLGLVLTSGLSHSAKLVAARLVFYMDWKTLGGAYPGPDRLANETQMSARSARRGLKELVLHGYLWRDYRAGPAPMRPSVYSARFPPTRRSN